MHVCVVAWGWTHTGRESVHCRPVQGWGSVPRSTRQGRWRLAAGVGARVGAPRLRGRMSRAGPSPARPSPQRVNLCGQLCEV